MADELDGYLRQVTIGPVERPAIRRRRLRPRLAAPGSPSTRPPRSARALGAPARSTSSTSAPPRCPDLAAKPIIDVLLVVVRLGRRGPACLPALEAAGYELRVQASPAFTSTACCARQARDVHLHVLLAPARPRSPALPGILRDRLRTDAADRDPLRRTPSARLAAAASGPPCSTTPRRKAAVIEEIIARARGG